jgi:hypothetical protein
VPKYDIYEIIKGTHIVTLLISVITSKGNIEFTSFFSDPFDVLVDVYMANRNTECECGSSCEPGGREERPDEIGELKEKMGTGFVEMVAKEGF